MSELSHAIDRPPTHQSVAARDRSQPGKVTGKLRVAIEAMVWAALPRAEAAAHAGMTEHGLYKALRKPPVRAYYLSECEVLRTSGRARRIHRLEQIAEQDDNKQAAVNAIKALDYQEDQQHAAAARSVSPGLVIVIEQRGTYVPHMAHERETEAKPLIEHEPGQRERREEG
jgi:hypothetical protein